MDSSGLKEDIFYSSSWMQEILEISNIGLWLLEINKNNTDVRLYADDKNVRTFRAAEEFIAGR